LIELSFGQARLARGLLARYPDATVTGLDVDERQHAKNLAAPQSRLDFVHAGAQAVPFTDASFDGALINPSTV
jgi:ubiquinone/menaquinone biosynthesis C-methylase UbiE